ncbi:metallophosphoesterase family protein [Flavisolibacter nicotianae]|uniref:hypothetical protein n=1 Tax=Flavisolibacter nicotianae TaxID=2364882 RepID=UPI0013C4D88F|nr:hypothetical protein [Flavisolibacter nicotianae]
MINRRNFLVKFTMAVGAVSVLRPFNVFADAGTKHPVLPGTDVMTILHTANIKGQWAALGIGEAMAGLGGLQNISQKITELKKEVPSILVIDAGNMTGRRQTNEERLLIYKKASRAGYDVIVPGRTDLVNGAGSLAELVKENNLHVILADYPSTTEGALLPYSVVRKGKTRIGIINAGQTALKGVQSTSILQASGVLNQTARRLRSAKKCTLVICVVQSSSQKCLELACLSDGIDVVVSAADKTSLHNTQIVRNKSNHEVIISYAGAKGAMMSRMDLTFNENGEKIKVASTAIFAGAGNETYASILKRHAVYNA